MVAVVEVVAAFVAAVIWHPRLEFQEARFRGLGMISSKKIKHHMNGWRCRTPQQASEGSTMTPESRKDDVR